MKTRSLKFLSIFALLILAACGTEPRNTVVFSQAGADQEFDLRNTICEADLPFAGANSPVRCYGRFQTTGAISDGLTFEIFDAYFIDQNLGNQIALHPTTIWPRITIDGIERGVIDGFVVFDEISNYSGGRVSFQYYLILPDATLQGYFSDNISVGAAF